MQNPLLRLKVFLGDGFAGHPIQHDVRVCGAPIPIWFPTALVAIFVDESARPTSLHDEALRRKGIRTVHVPADWVRNRPGPTLRRIEQILNEQKRAANGAA